jgi:hypothetical protein
MSRQRCLYSNAPTGDGYTLYQAASNRRFGDDRNPYFASTCLGFDHLRQCCQAGGFDVGSRGRPKRPGARTLRQTRWLYGP